VAPRRPEERAAAPAGPRSGGAAPTPRNGTAVAAPGGRYRPAGRACSARLPGPGPAADHARSVAAPRPVRAPGLPATGRELREPTVWEGWSAWQIEERDAARALAAQARIVAWASEGTPWQRFLRAISGGRWARQPTRLDRHPAGRTLAGHSLLGAARLEGAGGEPLRRRRLRRRLHRLRPLWARVGRVALHHGEISAVRAGHRGPGGAVPRAPRSVLAHPGRPLPGLPVLLGGCRRGRTRELSAARDLPARTRRVSQPACAPAGHCAGRPRSESTRGSSVRRRDLEQGAARRRPRPGG